MLETLVGIALLALLLTLMLAISNTTTDHAVKTKGKLAAAEKQRVIQRALGADLASLAVSPSALRCRASDDSWQLRLTINDARQGRQDVEYRWKKDSGNFTRISKTDSQSHPEQDATIIATGLRKLDVRWFRSTDELDAPDPSKAPVNWSATTPPAVALLLGELQAADEEGKRDALAPSKSAKTSNLRVILPVGGGTTS